MKRDFSSQHDELHFDSLSQGIPILDAMCLLQVPLGPSQKGYEDEQQ